MKRMQVLSVKDVMLPKTAQEYAFNIIENRGWN